MRDKLSTFQIQLKTLRRAPTKSYGIAPHKPILILSLIDFIEASNLTENQIPINHHLLEIFEQNWHLLVETGHCCDITKPIFHLQTDGLWKAFTKEKEHLDRARGISKLSFGQLDLSLFELTQSPLYRPILRMLILDSFFPNTQSNYLNQYQLPSYFSEMENYILEEPTDKYKRKFREEEGFVRDYKFQKKILEIYFDTCCMSGLKTTPNIGIVEACHILPHAHFGISHITNGIPLCRNLHRAFDY